MLVGIDGSPESELATEIAFDEAFCRGVDLVALHAWSDVSMPEVPGLDFATMEVQAQEALAEWLAGWQERYPDVTVQRVVVCDQPARQLVEHSESAQLVVVGSNGRGGFTGMLLGSVSTAVAHAARDGGDRRPRVIPAHAGITLTRASHTPVRPLSNAREHVAYTGFSETPKCTVPRGSLLVVSDCCGGDDGASRMKPRRVAELGHYFIE